MCSFWAHFYDVQYGIYPPTGGRITRMQLKLANSCHISMLDKVGNKPLSRKICQSVLVVIGLKMQKLPSDIAVLQWQTCPISNYESQ